MSNGTNTSSEHGHPKDLPLQLLPWGTVVGYSFFYAVVGIIGVMGNVGIIYAIIKKLLWPNYFVLLLAVADLTCCLCFLYVIIFLNLQDRLMSQFKCNFFCTPFIFSICSSNALTFFLGLDRLLTIAAPLKYAYKWRRYVLILAASFSYGAFPISIIAIPFGIMTKQSSGQIVRCIPPPSLENRAFDIWDQVTILFNVGTCIVYTLLCVSVRRSCSRHNTGTSRTGTPSSNRSTPRQVRFFQRSSGSQTDDNNAHLQLTYKHSQRVIPEAMRIRLARCVVGVITVYIISWLIVQTTFFIFWIAGIHERRKWILTIGCVILCNYAANPFIYYRSAALMRSAKKQERNLRRRNQRYKLLTDCCF